MCLLTLLYINMLLSLCCVQYEADVTADSGLLDIALGGHYVDRTQVTTELNEFLSTLPHWTVPIGWLATYESWII